MEANLLEAIIAILAVIIPIVGGVFGSQWQKAKEGLKSADLITTQIASTLHAFTAALEDDKVSPAEAKLIGIQLKCIKETLQGVGKQ